MILFPNKLCNCYLLICILLVLSFCLITGKISFHLTQLNMVTYVRRENYGRQKIVQKWRILIVLIWTNWTSGTFKWEFNDYIRDLKCKEWSCKLHVPRDLTLHDFLFINYLQEITEYQNKQRVFIVFLCAPVWFILDAFLLAWFSDVSMVYILTTT